VSSRWNQFGSRQAWARMLRLQLTLDKGVVQLLRKER
jgi:hypothetical protein